MAQMGELNEACVLDNLKQRYQSNLIYSFSGLFLIAINPYRNIPIYEDETVRWYRGQKRQDRPPHIFSVADGAYQALMTSRRSQSILITGESGAGKTENTKRVIHYLTSISSSTSGASSANVTGSSLEQQLILTNPILESFGNAQTVRNNNSSRFGKFIRIDFDPSGGHIVGASIEKYLLEKSRVTHRASAERNFHVFYQLIQGASSELLTELKLMKGSKRPTCNDFAYVSNSNSIVSGIDDASDFCSLQESLKVVGIDENECKEFFRVLAVILLLGNLKLTEDAQGQAHIPTSEDSLIEDLCELMGVEKESFKSALLNPVIRAGKEIVTQARQKEQVQRSIEALSKSLYERLFDRLVGRLNNLLFKTSNSNKSVPSTPFIGVLDIAGFEIFEKNSFEQLLINYTNEKLQQFFNHHMFIVEQEEYTRQGITWNFVDFGLDSQPVIDMLEKSNPVGILPCLDEDCVLPRANDKSFTEKVQQLCLNRNGTKFEIDKLKADKGFILNHYAGKVEYCTEGWVEKNKDPLNENVTRLLATTSNHLGIQEIFSEYGNNNERKITGKAGIFRTVAQKHRESLQQLMHQLGITQPHFVRCILPNTEKQPGLLYDRLVLEQLQCNGVLEGIRICRQGYPNRLTYSDFWRLYSILSDDVVKGSHGQGNGQGAESVTKFLNDLMGWKVDEDFALGQEKIFFRAGKLGKLDSLRDTKLSESLRQLQAICRGALLRAQRDRQSRQNDSIKLLQSTLRPFLSVRRNIWSRLIGRVRPLLTVTRSENRIKELQLQMTSIEQERDRQTSQLRLALNEERESLTLIEGKLGESERNRLNLQQIIQERQESLNQLTQKYENLQIDLEKSKNASKQLEKEIGSLQEDQKELQDKITSLEGEKQANLENYKKLKESFDEKSEQIIKTLNEKRLKEDEFGRKNEILSNENERLKVEIEESKTECKELQEEFGRKSEEFEQFMRESRNQQRILQSNEEKRRSELEEEIENIKRRFMRELENLRGELERERKTVLTLKESIKLYENGAEVEKTRNQQIFKREKERLESKIKELTRNQEESIEREEGLLEELKQRQDSQRQLKLRLQELEEDSTKTNLFDTKLAILNDQIRELTNEKNHFIQKYNEIQYEKDILKGQFEESEDNFVSLGEKLKCIETIKSVLEGELQVSRATCQKLTLERDNLQNELLLKRKSFKDEDERSPTLEKVIEMIEKDSIERLNLLKETRRIERELYETLQNLSDRDKIILQNQEAISRSESKHRKLQTALENSESQIIELERMKRRLVSELEDEKERADRLQRDFDRYKSNYYQRQVTTQSDPLLLSTSPSLYSIGRDLSSSSISSTSPQN